MVRAVGHLDKRTRAFRCQACARRRIKCDGEIPCSTCARLKKPCIPQQRERSQDVKFVAVVADPGSRTLSYCDVPSSVNAAPETHYKHHFMLFLINCHFTTQFSTLAPDFLRLVQLPGPLLDVVLAIGALEVSRKGSVRSLAQGDDPGRAALLLYGKSIRAFGTGICSPGFQPGEQALWTTFLLGLYELMSKVSSTEAWSMHMIQGMGQVVQYMPVSAKSTHLTRELLEVYRCLEINRTILYGTDTTLQPRSAVGREPASSIPSMTMSQELMLEASLLSHQMFHEIQPAVSDIHDNSIAIWWALKGVNFLQRLKDSLLHMRKTSSSGYDPFERLAIINCCALHLYFCRNFGYFPCFEGLEPPNLTEDETEGLMTAILSEAEQLCTNSKVPGLLLLFSLRVAGASAATVSHKTRVEKALERVHNQGFAVSKWIVKDVQEVWDWQESLEIVII